MTAGCDHFLCLQKLYMPKNQARQSFPEIPKLIGMCNLYNNVLVCHTRDTLILDRDRKQNFRGGAMRVVIFATSNTLHHAC